MSILLMLKQAKDFFTDAKQAAAQKIPILVMFSAPDCPYCELVKSEVIEPMSELKEYKNKVILRHILYSSLAEIIDFSGENSTHEQFSFKYVTNFYPTLLLFDDYGTVLGRKIGVVLIEEYWHDLDILIEQASKKFKQLEAIL
ncbi:MAG: thioredoxin fold domain-containing protein [Candidatus Thioglobus sp.]|nr:thioredoxin fold domain-containing protein [Candidatus Thioglobus sp.]